MAITSSQILSSNSLEELRQQFNNLQTDVTTLDSSGVSEIVVSANNSTNETVYPTFVDGATGAQGLESDTGLTYNPSTGVLTTTSVTGNLTGNVTGNTSGTAATVTTAAQSSITSLGTLTTLTVDSIIINGTNIGHTSDSDAIAISSGGVVTMDQIPVFSAGINVSGGTIAGTLATASQGNITTVGALDGGSITSGFGAIDNGTSNIRSATITAETAFVPDTSDGAALGTTALEFSDLYLADGGIIYFGDDQDINITHVADTGITTNGTFQATTITATTAFVPDASDGATLGTTSLEFSDLFLADGAVIYAGDDQDWQATHITDNEMRLADGDKWGFGAGGDLTIHHDGSNSYISDAGTGSLYVLGNTIQFNNAANTEAMLIASEDGAVTLYYDAASKLATSATGVSVTGDVIASGAVEPAGDTAAGDNAAIGYTAAEGLILTGQGSTSDITVKNDADATVFTVPTGTDDILFPDSAKAMWGAGSDLSLYHDGSNSYIDSGAVGSLYMRVNATENAIVAIQNSGVIVYYDGTEKLQTTSAGGTLTGTWNVTTNLTVAGNLTVTGTTTTVDTVTMNAANAVVFEGATADNYETTLSIVDPTADHTQYLINQGGYIPVLAAVTTTAITSTPAELNLLDTATAGTVVNSKALIYGGSGQVAATTLAVSSTSVFSGHVSQGDNIKTYYGTGNDLEIYHDGSNSYIKDTGTGALITYGSITKISGSSGEDGLIVTTGGAVEAYYANAKKFETTSAGATVTGVLTATLQANAIDSDHYVDDSIDTAHYAAGSVDATALGADCVTAAKIGDNVINSEHYAADSIDEEHLANDCVGSAELKTLSTLLIKNAAGSTLKTIHGAGA